MRDDESHPVAEELRDVHRRIDALKEESERHYSSLTDKLHQLEVAVATGNRFPAAAYVAAASLALTIIGTGTVLYSELQITKAQGSKALSLVEEHMRGASARFDAINRAADFAERWSSDMPVMAERIKSLESRIVGQGPEGWHKRDHDTYAAMVSTQINSLERRVTTTEELQQRICDRVRTCK